MFWFKRKKGNRRFGRDHVLDVKLRSSQVRATRVRLAGLALVVTLGTVAGFYALWRAGNWTLNCLIYENPSFAIQQVDISTDGVLAPEQLRTWSAVRPGENLLALDLSRVKRDLEMEPVIQSASIERILPRTLRIRVSEREPVAQVNVAVLRPGGRIEMAVFQLDADGYVMLPLEARQRATTAAPPADPLPVISGVNANDLQPGRRIDNPPVQAALELIDNFGDSSMAGLVELKRIDIASPGVLVVATGQGSEVTFGLENFNRQLARWREIYEMGARMSKAVATLDLAVTNNIPARWLEASAAPPGPKNIKTPRTRRKNV